MSGNGRAVLFLDVDGVLNSERWYLRRGKYRPQDGKPHWHHDVDPEAVAVLDHVVRSSGCDLILSSTWRLLWPLREISDFLRSLGLSVPLMGKTPERRMRGPYVDGVYEQRGHEIQAWLDGLAESPRAIAIVDDDADMAHLLPRLVQTDAKEGLRPHHINSLVRLLVEWRPASAPEREP